MIEKILRVEGLAVGVAVLHVYAHIEASWLLFLALFLVPDVMMFGYVMFDKKIAAQLYNFSHSYTLPVMLLALFIPLDNFLGIEISLIWLAHIGFDRAFGYGLKKSDGFQHTHLGWIGKTSIVSRKQEKK